MPSSPGEAVSNRGFVVVAGSAGSFLLTSRATFAAVAEIQPLHTRKQLARESSNNRCGLFQGEQDGCDAAHEAEQQDCRIDIEIGQHVADQHQFGRNWDAVRVSQNKNDDRNERDNLSQRQPVQERGQLDDKDLPQQIAESRRLIEGPFLPKLFPHRCPCLSWEPASYHSAEDGRQAAPFTQRPNSVTILFEAPASSETQERHQRPNGNAPCSFPSPTSHAGMPNGNRRTRSRSVTAPMPSPGSSSSATPTGAPARSPPRVSSLAISSPSGCPTATCFLRPLLQCGNAARRRHH